jgi:hypothetical protein
MFDLFLPQKPLRTLRTLRLGEIIFVFISRKGAKDAKKFDVYLVVTPNTSACSAPLRDFIVFSLAEAQRPQRTSMFIWYLPQTPLRALRLREIIYVFISRQGAEAAENFDVYLVLTQNTFACFAPWREKIAFLFKARICNLLL